MSLLSGSAHTCCGSSLLVPRRVPDLQPGRSASAPAGFGLLGSLRVRSLLRKPRSELCAFVGAELGCWHRRLRASSLHLRLDGTAPSPEPPQARLPECGFWIGMLVS